MKAVTVLLTGVTAFGTLVATAFAWFAETFCDENCTPNDRHPGGLVLLALLAFVSACLAFAGVALGRRRLALFAYASQVIAALVLLSKALGESQHSDGKLDFFALVVELPAAAAITISVMTARDSPRTGIGNA